MYYIGIAGQNKYRKEVATLLSKVIICLKNGKCVDWDEIKCVAQVSAISIDSFGGYILSAVQTIFPSLWGHPLDDDEYIKSHWIDINTFNVYEYYDAKYIRLDEFILYFANTVMKKAFGENVWIRLMHHEPAASQLIIYHDVKTDAEQAFIKEHGGIIIGVNWDRAKQDKLMLKDPQFDIKIKSTDFNEETFTKIAQQIIKKFNL